MFNKRSLQVKMVKDPEEPANAEELLAKEIFVEDVSAVIAHHIQRTIKIAALCVAGLILADTARRMADNKTKPEK